MKLGARIKKMALVCALHYQSPTMKQKLVVLLVLTLSAWSPVFSAADTPETRRKEAERYLQVSPPKALFEDMADKMAETLPADEREQFVVTYVEPIGSPLPLTRRSTSEIFT